MDRSHWQNLLLYHSLSLDPVIIHLMKGENQADAFQTLLLWAEEEGIHGNILQKYLLYRLLMADNPFSRGALRGEELETTGLFTTAAAEFSIVQGLLHRDIPGQGALKEYRTSQKSRIWQEEEDMLFASFLEESPADFAKKILIYYKKYGFGNLAFHPFFHWENGLSPILNPDLVELDDLLGYETQKNAVIRNTEAFLQGLRANNVLLYGERGTGKSSTVKGLGKRFWKQGLRIIELKSKDISQLDVLSRYLNGVALHFIVYIDDLSFEDFETEYKEFKAILEGGLSLRPDNILIYATSNRRHLINENWKEREVGEVYAREVLNEKLSLADRFGLTIAYLSPDQEEFLAIVADIAKKRGIDTPWEIVKQEALLWEKWQHGLSGRSAVQFINDMEIRQRQERSNKNEHV